MAERGPVASIARETGQGLPCLRLTLPGGDAVLVALHGAHVLSWVAAGRERLYLSPRSHFDGRAAIRGGVPVCFPQFNQRGPLAGLPKHGFVRNLPWQADAPHLGADAARLTLRLAAGEATRAFMAQDFAAALTVELAPAALRLTLDVYNPGASALAFTGALHTYFAVDDIAQARLEGLDGCAEWDSVTDRHAGCAGPLAFEGEFDRVYAAAPRPLVLVDGGGQRLQIRQSASFGHTVVWSPGAERCAALPDLPPDGYRHMLCVEAAQVFEPVTLAPGAAWQGWQQLQVL